MHALFISIEEEVVSSICTLMYPGRRLCSIADPPVNLLISPPIDAKPIISLLLNQVIPSLPRGSRLLG